MKRKEKRMLRATATCCLVFFAMSTPSLADRNPVKVAADVAESANRDFAGLSFGVGISATVDTGDRDRVSDASIDANGIVRVSKKENVRARVMLESHYLFPYRKLDSGELMTSGFGPFIALQPGTNEIIEAVGVGIMFGWRRRGSTSGQSFNLGIGFVVDPSVKVLGDEFKEDEAAPLDPEGEPIPVRFQERDQGGVLLLVSFSFD